jgi:FMN phosphatase YigB (HAD superfamily)
MGYKLLRVLYVGDSYSSDVVGASDCHMVCVWLDRPGGQHLAPLEAPATVDPFVPPDICISSLNEMRRAVLDWCTSRSA